MSRSIAVAAAALSATLVPSWGALAQETPAPAGENAPGEAPPASVAPQTEQNQGYTLTPRAALRLTMTDNARGTPTDRVADFITSPEIGFTGAADTPRLKGAIALGLGYDKYTDATDQDGARQNLLGTGTAEVLREHFFIDAQASISEEPITRAGQLSATDRSLNNNQATTQVYRLSPALRTRFGGTAEAELRYGIGETLTDGALADATRHEFGARLKSGPDFTSLDWSLSAAHSITDRSHPVSTGFGSAADSTEQSAFEAAGRYAVNREFALLGSFGYQLVDDPTLTESLDGPTLTIGFELTPGPRTKLRVVGNHRNNSNFASGLASYEFINGDVATFTYDETVTSGQDLLLNNVSALGTNQQGQFINTNTGGLFDQRGTSFGVGDLSNSTVRRRAATLTYLGALGERTIFNLRARHETNDTVSGTAQDEQSDGVFASVTRALGPYTNLTLSADYVHSTIVAPQTETDDSYLVSLGVAFNLTETVIMGIDGRVLRRFSNLSGQDLRETAAVVSLRKTF